MRDSGMDGAARSTHKYIPSAGFNQRRSMLVTCSVFPSLCKKIETNLVPDLHRQRRLCSSEPRHRHTIRRRAHVVETDRVEEVHGCGIAAVLAADAEFQVGPRLASELHTLA